MPPALKAGGPTRYPDTSTPQHRHVVGWARGARCVVCFPTMKKLVVLIIVVALAAFAVKKLQDS